MEKLSLILVMFVAVTYVSSHQRTYQPYGPAMCRTLKTRYGSSIRYHGNSLTCVVSDERIVSANMICAEVIATRKGEAVCIQVTSPEPLSPRLFLKSNGTFITSLDILSGKQMSNFTLRGSEPFMSCVKDDQKLYFYSKTNGSFSLDLNSHNIETVTRPHEKEVIGMALDVSTQILYVITKHEVLEWKMRQDSDFQLFHGKLTLTGIVVSSKRSQVIVYSRDRISRYESKTRLIYHEQIHRWITGIVYDNDKDLMYIFDKKYLKKMSWKDEKPSLVKIFPGNILLHIDVYQDIAFVSLNNKILTAINMTTSKTEVWSRRLSQIEDLCVLP